MTSLKLLIVGTLVLVGCEASILSSPLSPESKGGAEPTSASPSAPGTVPTSGEPQAPGHGTVPGGTGGAGGSTGAGGATGAPNECDGISPNTASPAVFRRLTNDQYSASARDLLAAPSAVVTLQAQAGLTVTDVEVQKLVLAVEQLVALKKHGSFATCSLDGAADASCAGKFIDALGRMAFRRTLAADEKALLVAVYDTTLKTTGLSSPITFREAIDTVAQVILQSPQMLYVKEHGVADTALPPGIKRLSGPERASRLSYVLWGSTPDKVLLDAAESGALDTEAGVRTQATRMLTDARAHAAVKRFASQWLSLDATTRQPSIESVPKSAALFPYDSLALRAAMRTESEALYERVFYKPGSSFAELMTTTDAYVNGPLATLYGVTGGPTTAAQFAWTTLDSQKRAGLFTRLAFLAHKSGAEHQSPIQRGVSLLRNALCLPLPDPPPNADDTPPTNSGATVKSIRELTDAKTAGAQCQSCHKAINGLGYTLENFGAMGQHQTADTFTLNGVTTSVPVNSTSTVNAADLPGTLSGATHLAQALAQSGAAHDCQVQTWYFKAFDRKPALEDMCALNGLRDEFKKTHDMRSMLLSLTSSGPALFIR